MNQIIITLFSALAFVQLVSSQTPCLDAQTALSSDLTCVSATDAATICLGGCRSLFDDIINNCDTTVSEYSQLLTAYNSFICYDQLLRQHC